MHSTTLAPAALLLVLPRLILDDVLLPASPSAAFPAAPSAAPSVAQSAAVLLAGVHSVLWPSQRGWCQAPAKATTQQHGALEGAHVSEQLAPTAEHSLPTLVNQNHLTTVLLCCSFECPVEALRLISLVCENVLFFRLASCVENFVCDTRQAFCDFIRACPRLVKLWRNSFLRCWVPQPHGVARLVT